MLPQGATSTDAGALTDDTAQGVKNVRTVSSRARRTCPVMLIGRCFAYPRKRLAQFRCGATHLGNAFLVFGLKPVEVGAAEGAIRFIQAHELAAAAAKAQQRRDAAGLRH